MYPAEQIPPPPVPTQEHATDFLVSSVRQKITVGLRPTYGYQIWLPNIIEEYVKAVSAVQPPRTPSQWIQQCSEPFYSAAWDLCRLGVLRPGTLFYGAQMVGDGDGYCITPRGHEWLAGQEAAPFIPTDPSRTANLLVSIGGPFGSRYRTRATDAAVCYSAGAFYACCSMVGAAAESILLSLGTAKLGEGKAERTYRSKNGRQQLADAVLAGTPSWLERDFRGHIALINLWRDRSAYAQGATATEGEAYMALRGLLRFARLVSEHWSEIAANSGRSAASVQAATSDS
jgi:hypothetical protein